MRLTERLFKEFVTLHCTGDDVELVVRATGEPATGDLGD